MADNYWTVLLISKGEREKTKKIFPFKSGATKWEKTITEYGIKINVDYKFSMNWKSTDVTKKKREKFVSVSVVLIESQALKRINIKRRELNLFYFFLLRWIVAVLIQLLECDMLI